VGRDIGDLGLEIGGRRGEENHGCTRVDTDEEGVRKKRKRVE
jgi:hypothetical protein